MNESGGILLAGGLSSRMGSDKASLVFNDQTLLERLIRTVQPLVSQLIVMLSAQQKLPPISSDLINQIDIGRDSRPAQGPLRGIGDAMPLVGSHIDNLFVLSSDLPYLTTEWLNRMRQSLVSDVDGVCAEVDSKVNPLLAIYQRRLLNQSVSYLASGKRSCLVLIDGHRIVRLSPPADNPLVCNDINTPAAYEWAKSVLVKSD
ncbi:MAG: molybdenum cofactor guanylyltransferase [Deltaproteobacteria bacterium]|jgi:molybdenum cofactor guanylyltransferase|nr:molybdenum cofactor guanylyltransferase [Deltaproteobacteria bacterium]MBT4263711.1 molybdenum cofactor guanylyltransferase [Deltaproteobacteria bacterium]MBT4639761.1 molybdenum cofactor guanylyltransferase [Deltaproteobacteria bacterium]MBT6500176.1 molybdenum cofactor guanylyltransferase [Deltaproteobacteria bacterium]MBT6612982.1 molybdenum cofactor guanylyltransferase [Deltaproteobacteria bacterium]